MGRRKTTGTKEKKKQLTPDKKNAAAGKRKAAGKKHRAERKAGRAKTVVVEKKVLVKKTVQDSVFTDLFQIKKYTLELYKTLHPEDTEITEDDIEIVTLSNVLLDQEYNDLGFNAKKAVIVLVEAQSTWTVNILIRIVLYLAQTWKEHILKTGQNIYGYRKVTVPTPEFYVVFTGKRKNKPAELTLSDEFFKGTDIDLNVKIHMLYGTDGDDIVSQYVNFTKVYKEQYHKYGRDRKTALETIRICREKNYLREYFENREKEAVSIMMALFDQETILNAYLREATEEARAQAVEQGMKQGMKQGMEQGLAEGKAEGKAEGISLGRMQEKKRNGITVIKDWNAIRADCRNSQSQHLYIE